MDNEIDLTPGRWNDVALPRNQKVRWMLKPTGLSAPKDSDCLTVQAILAFPCDARGKLPEELRFGDRLCMGKLPLVEDFGDNVDGCRSCYWTVSATTWQQALEEAAILLQNHIDILRRFLGRRERYMKSEGWVLVEASNVFKEKP